MSRDGGLQGHYHMYYQALRTRVSILKRTESPVQIWTAIIPLMSHTSIRTPDLFPPMKSFSLLTDLPPVLEDRNRGISDTIWLQLICRGVITLERTEQ